MIWASDIIAVMIGRDTAPGIAGGLQIDAEAGVREDGVAENGVVDVPGVYPDAYSGTKAIAGSTVEGDDVARAGDHAAHGVVVAGGAAVINYVNAHLWISRRLSACDIRADNVALDEIARPTGHVHTIDTIARDQIPRRRAGRSCQSADDVFIRIDRDAQTPRIWQGYCSRNVRADEVALNRHSGTCAEGVNAIGV